MNHRRLIININMAMGDSKCPVLAFDHPNEMDLLEMSTWGVGL